MRSIYFSFFLLEFKKWMGYRVDFWLQFFVNMLVEVSIAYFLWDSIFSAQQVEVIGGFTFDQMILYYIIGSFVGKMVRTGDEFQVSREIYEGSLTKFLLYPISTLWLKLVVKFSYSFLAYTQFILCLCILPLILNHYSFEPLSILVGTYILLFSIVVSYFLNILMELVAFWADNVWTLIVLMRFVSQFLGGAYLPISLFPDEIRRILMYSPFPYTYYVPTKILMGDWSLQTFIEAQVLLILWVAILLGLTLMVWRRGQLKYTGVGQ